ncbi:hypothetical protein AbraIFM66950_003777 [Aspergillus brasiliensis]|nr:hypothetical protein AbraIFM66950_003777 [Aspergillus brasiliensis]
MENRPGAGNNDSEAARTRGILPGGEAANDADHGFCVLGCHEIDDPILQSRLLPRLIRFRDQRAGVSHLLLLLPLWDDLLRVEPHYGPVPVQPFCPVLPEVRSLPSWGEGRIDGSLVEGHRSS